MQRSVPMGWSSTRLGAGRLVTSLAPRAALTAASLAWDVLATRTLDAIVAARRRRKKYAAAAAAAAAAHVAVARLSVRGAMGAERPSRDGYKTCDAEKFSDSPYTDKLIRSR